MHGPYSVLIILVITMALFIWGYWRYDVVAIIALTISVVIGAVPFDRAYSGLDNPAVITVACVMVISKSITRSGIIDILVKKITRVIHNPILHVGSLSVITAVLSAFMNNVGALALMMPVAIQTSIRAKRSPSFLLLPIALASALGGLTTVIGTPPNLLVSSYRAQFSGSPFSMFDFSHAGFFIALIGIVFITLVGWRLIPSNRKSPSSKDDLFQVQDYVTEVSIPSKSAFVGKTVADLQDKVEADFVLLGLIRNKRKRLVLLPDQVLEEKDILIIEAAPDSLRAFVNDTKFDLITHEKYSAEILRSKDVSLIEAVVPPAARVENRSAKMIRLLARYRINLVAIARQGKPFKQRLHDVKLKAGDVVLLQGPNEGIRENIATLGLLPLVERDIRMGLQPRRWLALIIFTLAIIVAATQLVPVQIAFGGAVLLLVISRAIPPRLVYDSIDWPVIILLAAMIPVGEALRSTGGTALIAHLLTHLTKFSMPALILGLLLVVTMTLSDFMNNAATAVVMGPIAASVAQAMHASVDPFLMAVAIGASCSFLTPVGHQNNTLVMGPGGYKFTDYIRIGLPLEIIILIVSLPLLLWAWPLGS